MDRLNQLRDEAGGSGDSTLDTTSPPSEAFMSANENSSKYFSINDSTFDNIDVSLASTSAVTDRSVADSDELISNLSPIGKKDLDSYSIGKQIEAANILSGGVDIFDGDDNSFDGNELVIDDNIETEDKSNQAETPPENIAEVEAAPEPVVVEPQPVLAEPEPEPVVVEPPPILVEPEPALVAPEVNVNVANREMEVVLQIDGNNVNAIDIGNGLYLYRKGGSQELAAIQIIDNDPQHSFKFLKVRDNAEGNLEVYEEIEIEVPKQVPTKEAKVLDKNTPNVPTKDNKNSASDSTSPDSKVEGTPKETQNEPVASTSTSQKNHDEKQTSQTTKTEVNQNGKMKYIESRKSPVVGSFTPMTYHSTPNKEGKPLTKTMVDFQLDPNRHSDNVKKTIEVHTDCVKQKSMETPSREKDTIDQKPTEILSKGKDTIDQEPTETLSKEKDAIEQKPTETVLKEKHVSENIKPADVILEENISEETKITSSIKEDNNDQKKQHKNQDGLVKVTVSTGETQESKISQHKEKEILDNKLVENQNNDLSLTKNIELSKEKNKLTTRDNEIVEKEANPSNITDSNEISKLDESKVGQASPSTSTKIIKPTINISATATNDSQEANNKPSKQDKMSVTNVNVEPIDKLYKPVEQPSENKSESVTLEINKVKPVEPIPNISNEKKDMEQEKLPNIKILENIPVKLPLSSTTNKPKIDLTENSKKPNNDNLVKFPLESFSEVSSTCTNLGSDESKEESITLYSIDTDESVSLITPSSTTKISDDKIVITDKISEVLTTISNLSESDSKNTLTKNENTIVSTPSQEFLPLLPKAKNEADSTSKGHSAKSEKSNTASTSQNQKCLKDIKEQVTINKLSEKVISPVPTSKEKVSETTGPKEKPKEHPDNKSSMKEILPVLMPETKSSEHVPSSEVKSLPKTSQDTSKLQININKPIKCTALQNVKTTTPTTKLETKALEKSTVLTSVVSVNTIEKKKSAPDIKPLNKVTNTTSIRAETKQLNVSSTTCDKIIKPDSHIPIMSVVSKPSSKHIPIPKVEAVIKPLDKTRHLSASQKEFSKNNSMEKQSSTIKIETRELKEPLRKINVDSKPINNNRAPAVPFGKWTDAHRQEFVNKFKEIKAPPNTNSKQIKNSNDLNRRDVLQKIDSQRAQTISNATAKNQEKNNVKSETVFSSKVISPSVESKVLPVLLDNKLNQAVTKVMTKQENLNTSTTSTINTNSITSEKKSLHVKAGSTEQSPLRDEEYIVELIPKDHKAIRKAESSSTNKEQNTASCYMASLIDKTIEDLINKPISSKGTEELKQPVAIKAIETNSIAQKSTSVQVSKSSVDDSVSLDDIEMKMNELHGIPFVERPPHELPKIPKAETKTYSKVNKTKPLSLITKVTNTKYANKEPKIVKDLDSDEELIEHEPITGDIDMKKKSIAVKVRADEKKNVTDGNTKAFENKQASNADVEIITEKEFDKFARRNSITYENCLTVNFDRKEPQNVVQPTKGKDPITKVIPKHESSSRVEVKSKQAVKHQTDKSQGLVKHGNVSSDSSNKKYQSKIHSAYQSALTAKHQVSRPITIIEDKPVKVVFLESSVGFVPGQLNVQGQQLSPAKKTEPETAINTNNDSVDSGTLDVTDENKQDKTKSKHQRKQVLTPVEVPDLELIQPSDIGIETTPKKKRKLEDVQTKNLLPKKSYLLGRSTANEEKIASVPALEKDNKKYIANKNEDVVEHKNAASAIDNLVKAAELLENQSESLNKSISPNPVAQIDTPVKRGRGRPRKYPLPDGAVNEKSPSPQKKPKLIDAKPIKQHYMSDDDDDDDSLEEGIVRENWTMGKINENIICPICNKLFRSENVVFKHVKHCTGVSPNRSESDKKSPRRSRLSQESEDMDFELISNDGKKETPKKRKSKESAKSEEKSNETKISEDKVEVIVIEDTPIKEKPEKLEKGKEDESKKESKSKVPHKNKSLVCEFCGKTFRQQSYLASHKLQHKKELARKKEKDRNDSEKLQVFSCEICKKEFRKLHHLVQHRINHNPETAPKRVLRKSLSEQNDTKSVKEDTLVKQVEDASAGFRCEPCDKSFRKLHHLVEHRGTHDGINRQKSAAPPQPAVDKQPPPPQCEICKKTFRKLHHLIEHKEQHADTSSDKSDDKSIKSALSTKDIIHECSLCYMVFPNEHSLNKHFANCSKKKRQSKQPLKDAAGNDITKQDENSSAEKNNDDVEDTEIIKIVDDDNVAKEQVTEEVKRLPKIDNIVEIKNPVVTEITQVPDEKITSSDVTDKADKSLPKEEIKSVELLSAPAKRDMIQSVSSKEKEGPVVPEKITKIDLKESKSPDVPKKKTVLKDKSTPHVTKRQKSIDVIQKVEEVKPSVESSDDDEIRYMLNPNFKFNDTSEGKSFMKVRASKRNSLQIERPTSNDHVKRRTSLQLPPKVSRLKTKSVEVKTKPAGSIKPKAPEVDIKVETKVKVTETKNSSAPSAKSKQPKVSIAEAVLSTDSDDSDVTYSFPTTTADTSKPVTERPPKEKEPEKKTPRKSLAEKRKSLGGIAKRKSLGKVITAKHKEIPVPVKPIKKRTLGVEHRCDCGELFSSAALLARHTSLAHTPPRIRRRRGPPSPAPAPPRRLPAPPAKKTARKTESPATKKTELPATRKTESPADTRKSAGALPAPPKTRRSAAHSGVPVPEKMRKLMQKK